MSFLPFSRFLEAEKIVERIDKEETKLLEKLESMREEVADRHVQQYVRKQDQEMNVLKLKIISKRNEIEKQKIVEKERYSKTPQYFIEF